MRRVVGGAGSAALFTVALVFFAVVGCGGSEKSAGGSSESEQAQRCLGACAGNCLASSPTADADKQSCQVVCRGAIVGLTAVCAQCVVAGISGCAQPRFSSPGSSDCAAVCAPTSDAGPSQ